ncbi:MAG: hypothetical protein Q8L54_03965 [Devosia sp.]|nr:hypothetical protein [Devosia sp.]
MVDQLGAICRAFAVIALLGATAACARPVGDLGRAQPGVLHDEILPTIGKTRAELAGEPVSKFNLTDQEREMHDRVWRFLVAAHAYDWFYDVSAELQRIRLSGARDHKFKPDRYYRWLRQTEYASSRVRYQTVADHVTADLDTMPGTFRAICAVLEVDRQRGIAAREVAGLGAAAGEHALARKAENTTRIDWFVRAVAYRYDSYGYALDHLLVETPHEEAIKVDGLLSRLATHVERAQRGDFCQGSGGAIGKDGDAIRPRVLMPAPGAGAHLK